MVEDWKTVTEVSTDEWDRQGTVQGVYAQKKTNVGPNESNLYVLKTKDKDISVWGSTVLDSRFEQIPVGAEVRITSLGKVKSPSTNREYYDYKVEFRAAPFQEAGEPSKPADEVPVESRDEIDIDEIPFS